MPAEVPTLKAADGEGPRHADGDARNSTRTDSRATFATLRLHRTYRSSVWRTDRYVASDAVASTTEASNNVAWPLLKNQAFTSGANTWPPLAGCLLTDRRRGDPH